MGGYLNIFIMRSLMGTKQTNNASFLLVVVQKKRSMHAEKKYARRKEVSSCFLSCNTLYHSFFLFFLILLFIYFSVAFNRARNVFVYHLCVYQKLTTNLKHSTLDKNVSRVNILATEPYFSLTDFWLKSYFFLDFHGVFGETVRAVHLI